jgi:predicted SnoaL-like aldol condensation-catalyzing enzyme
MNHQGTNKKTSIDFCESVTNRNDLESAPKFVDKYYKQHDQHAKDGIEGLQEYVKFAKEKYTNSRSKIKKAFGGGYE